MGRWWLVGVGLGGGAVTQGYIRGDEFKNFETKRQRQSTREDGNANDVGDDEQAQLEVWVAVLQQQQRELKGNCWQ